MSSTESDYFQIATTDNALIKKGGAAFFGTPAGTTVESFKEIGDWIDIQMSGGYRISLHESRITYILTRDAA